MIDFLLLDGIVNIKMIFLYFIIGAFTQHELAAFTIAPHFVLHIYAVYEASTKTLFQKKDKNLQMIKLVANLFSRLSELRTHN